MQELPVDPAVALRARRRRAGWPAARTPARSSASTGTRKPVSPAMAPPRGSPRNPSTVSLIRRPPGSGAGSRWPSRFMPSVIRKSSAPTAKMVWYSIVPARRVAQADLHDVGGHGLDALERVERQLRRGAGGQGDGHGLADGPGSGQDEGGEHAARARRAGRPASRPPAGRAEGVARLAQRVGHGAQRVVAERGHHGQDHDPDHDRRAGRVEDLGLRA